MWVSYCIVSSNPRNLVWNPGCAGNRARATARRTHHDGKERAQRVEEGPVEVVRHGVADRVAEAVQEDLANDPERRAEQDVADRPPVVERAPHEEQLCDDVDDDAGEVEDELEDPEACWGGGREARGVLERADRDQADNDADDC